MPLKELPKLADLPAYDLQDWLKNVTESLKNGSIEELDKEKYGFRIKAFTDAQIPGSAPLQKATKEWLIGCRIKGSSEKEMNEECLFFLNQGAEAVSFEWKAEQDLLRIMDGVKSEYIYTDIAHDFQAKSEMLKSCFGDEASGFLGDEAVKPARFHSELIRSKHDILLEELSEICRRIDKLLQSGQTQPDQIRIELSLDGYIPIAVSKIRAMRILWLNLLKAHNQTLIPAFISCDIKSKQADPNTALIELSVAALNAVVGGCDLLYLDGHDFDRNQRRLAMNIQHVMKMESKLHLVQDPLAGAYAIEDLTAQIATAVWQRGI